MSESCPACDKPVTQIWSGRFNGGLGIQQCCDDHAHIVESMFRDLFEATNVKMERVDGQ